MYCCLHTDNEKFNSYVANIDKWYNYSPVTIIIMDVSMDDNFRY